MTAPPPTAPTPADPIPAATSDPTADGEVEELSSLGFDGGKLDRAADALNPILIKEVRQSFRSKQFLGSFWLLLGASWLIGTAGLLFAGDAVEYGAVGGAFFALFYSVLAFAVLLLVPYGAFRSVLAERQENTWETLSITSLSPRQIVLGKIACAMMQTLLYFSAVAPFIAFCALLQGFDPRSALFFLALTAWGSLVASSFAVMLAAVVKQKVWQGAITAVLLVGLMQLIPAFIATVFGSSVANTPPPFDRPEFWAALGAGLVASGSYVVLFVNAAAAGLTFDADNRSTAVRVTVTVQFWLLVAACLIVGRIRPGLLEWPILAGLLAGGAFHWLFWGLVFAAEPDDLSRRVRRSLPAAAPLRLLAAPWLPGGSRGVLLALGHAAALLGLAAAARVYVGPALNFPAINDVNVRSLGDVPPAFTGGDRWTRAAFCGVCYLTMYVSLCGLVMRAGRAITDRFPPAGARLTVLILGPMGVIPPFAARLLDLVNTQEPSVVDVLSPVMMLPWLTTGSTTNGQLTALGTMAAASALASGPFVVRQLADLLRPRTAAEADAINAAAAPAGAAT